MEVSDALAWWHEHQNEFPHLHRMALNYLSIPGTPLDASLIYQIWTLPSGLMYLAGQLPTTQNFVTLLYGCRGAGVGGICL